MTDLAERFARVAPGYEDRDWHEKNNPVSQLWWECRRCGAKWYECGTLTPPKGSERPPICHALPPKIDERILPLIWADCKAKGWHWSMNCDGATIWVSSPLRFLGTEYGSDPIAALCEAYCSAKEATE